MEFKLSNGDILPQKIVGTSYDLPANYKHYYEIAFRQNADTDVWMLKDMIIWDEGSHRPEHKPDEAIYELVGKTRNQYQLRYRSGSYKL